MTLFSTHELYEFKTKCHLISWPENFLLNIYAALKV